MLAFVPGSVTPVYQDSVHNMQGHGVVGQGLQGCRFEPGLLRPYWGPNGGRYVSVNVGYKTDTKTRRTIPVYKPFRLEQLEKRGIYSPVGNATSLRKQDWIELDKAVLMVARQELRAWADLESKSSFGGFNAMGRSTLEYEAMSDPGEAQVAMDILTHARGDRPLFSLRSLPLPITYSGFSLGQRELLISRQSDTPLDTTLVESCTRRVVEKVEQTLIGTETGVEYGTQTTGNTAHTGLSKVYGYTNFPNRLTKTNLTTPTGANPQSTVADVLAMRNQLYQVNHKGPFMLYHSDDWDTYMDNDYAFVNGSGWAASPDLTLRERLRKIQGIEDVVRLDYLDATTNPFTLIMVELKPETAQAVNGMAITVIQWETMGGMQLNFIVMCIMVPRLRYDYNGNTGLLHATTS